MLLDAISAADWIPVQSHRAGFARPTPCCFVRLILAARPSGQAGDGSARLARLRIETPPRPLTRALPRAFAGRSDRATLPAARAGDEPARPFSLRRANPPGQPPRRPMAWRRAACIALRPACSTSSAQFLWTTT